MFAFVESRYQHIARGRMPDAAGLVAEGNNGDHQHISQGEIAEYDRIIDHQIHGKDDQKQYK
jgi:hypothetical protein